MRSPSPIERLIAERTDLRLRTAEAAARRALARLRGEGYEAALIGSLATGRFRLHSDIDLLVRNPVDPAGRAAAERCVADILRDTGIPYDLIFAGDLTPGQREAFEHDRIVPSGLREARSEA